MVRARPLRMIKLGVVDQPFDRRAADRLADKARKKRETLDGLGLVVGVVAPFFAERVACPHSLVTAHLIGRSPASRPSRRATRSWRSSRNASDRIADEGGSGSGSRCPSQTG